MKIIQLISKLCTRSRTQQIHANVLKSKKCTFITLTFRLSCVKHARMDSERHVNP